MKIPGFRPRSKSVPSIAHDVGERFASVAWRLARVVTHTAVTAVRLVDLVPATADTARTGGLATASGLQRLPDSTLRWLAASSAGLGAGFYLAGAPRPVVAASLAPALVMGAAIILRPTSVEVLDTGHWWSLRHRSQAS